MRWFDGGWLAGPHRALPRPLDAAAERWAALRPRARSLLVVALVLVTVAGVQLRVRAVDARWGGSPVTVFVAPRDLPVGAPAKAVERAVRPPAAVPPTAATGDPPDDATLAFALPEGSVLTESHLEPRGPAAGLDASLRAIPVPVEEGWGVAAGGWVDVWVLGVGDEPATLVGRSRPVLELREEETALVGLRQEDEVGPVTEGLALGRVLLAHAPPPDS